MIHKRCRFIKDFVSACTDKKPKLPDKWAYGGQYQITFGSHAYSTKEQFELSPFIMVVKNIT